MSKNKDTVSISYSSAQKYKTCPEKFFLSKKYQTKLMASAFPFGKAIESGVEALLKGAKLEEALDLFRDKWYTEDAGKDGIKRQIFDNDNLQFYFSDYDKNTYNDDDVQLLTDWIKECELDTKKDWQELFEDIADRYKANNDSPSSYELKFYNRVIWLACEIRGQVMIRAFHDKLLPKLKLVKVGDNYASQFPLSMKNEDGDAVTGYIDFVVEHEDYREPIIVDLKTAAYFYPDHALNTSEQLRTYVAAKGSEFKTARAGYIVLVKKLLVKRRCNTCGSMQDGMKKNCAMPNCKGKYSVPELDANVQFICKEYKTEELEDVLNDYMNVATAVKNEIRFKNPNNCTQYNRQCEYYDHCWKRKALEEMAHLEAKKSLTPTDESDTTD